MMDKIIERIENSEKIIVTAHMGEDADAIGSLFAFAEAMRNVGKKVTLVLSDEPEQRLRFLKSDYVIFEKEMRYEADLAVFLDSADEKRLGERKVFLENFPSVSIDHHYTNTNYADLNYVDPDASSTGELIYILLKKMNIEITEKIAEFLYTALSGDTGSFKYSCTSAKTMRIAADLLETGIDFSNIARRIHDCESLENTRLRGHLMSEIKSCFSGLLKIVTIEKDVFEHFGIEEKDAGDLVNIPRMIEGTQIAVSIRETNEKIKLSFRSNGIYNVSDIAAVFGGGGHMMAAGAAVSDSTVEEVEKRVIEAVGEAINDRI